MRLPSGSKLTIPILLIALTVLGSGSSKAESLKSPEQAFDAFYAAFVDAVRANDKNKIADLIEYPVSAWAVQTKGNVQEIGIANKSDFLSKYDSLFTPSMRSHALKTKPQKIDNDRYTVIWHDTDLEYSFEFERKPAYEFRLTMYLIGPR
jgi:uncharacterized membrane protein YvbJ